MMPSVPDIAWLQSLAAELMVESGLDRRSCFVGIAAEPPDGHVRVECSDGIVAARLRAALTARDPQGVVEVIQLGPRERTDSAPVWVTTNSVADVRREPSHAAELVSQTIHGDRVDLLKEAGDWCLVRLDDGYIGWIRTWHLDTMSAGQFARFDAAAAHRVHNNVIQLFESPDIDAPPVTDAVVGTPLHVTASPQRGWRRVELADGREGYVRSRDIETRPRRQRHIRERVAATGQRFLGIPYLWGGTTPKGFDCSGLIQRIFRLHGVILPRDSDQQARVGREKPRAAVDALRSGDLMFFAKARGPVSHVAMYLSSGRFLHAHGRVRVGSLEPTSPDFDAQLIPIWRYTRDPLD